MKTLILTKNWKRKANNLQKMEQDVLKFVNSAIENVKNKKIIKMKDIVAKQLDIR